MKTLEQIKNEIAVKKGYLSWSNLISSGHLTITLGTIDELLILVQKECLKNASKNVNLNSFDTDRFGNSYLKGTIDGVGLECGTYYEVNKESITIENNLIV